MNPKFVPGPKRQTPLDGFNLPAAPKPPKGSEKTTQVAKEQIPIAAQAQQPKIGFFGKAVQWTAIKTNLKAFRTKEQAAKALLKSRVVDEAHIETALQPHMESIYRYIESLGLPIDMSNEEMQQMVQALIWVMLGNIAGKVVRPNEQVTAEELADRSLRYLVTFFGERIDRADQALHEGQNAQAVFEGFVKETFETFLGLDGLAGVLLKMFTPKISSTMLNSYVQAKEKIQNFGLFDPGAAVQVKNAGGSPLDPLIGQLGRFLANTTIKRLEREDVQFFQKVAGLNEAELKTLIAPYRQKFERQARLKLESALPAVFQDHAELTNRVVETLFIQLAGNVIKNKYAGRIANREKLDLKVCFDEVLKDTLKEGSIEKTLISVIEKVIPPDVPFLKLLFIRNQPLIETPIQRFVKIGQFIINKLEDGRAASRAELQRKVKDADALEKLLMQLGGVSSSFAKEKALGAVLPEGVLSPEAEELIKANLLNHADSAVQSLFLKVAVNLLPEPPARTKWSSDEVMVKMMEGVLNFGYERVPDIVQKLQAGWKGRDEEARLNFAKELTEKLTLDMLKEYAGLDLINQLPLPAEYRESLLKYVIDTVNTTVAKTMITATSWSVMHEENEIALNKEFLGLNADGKVASAPVKVAHMAARMIKTSIPYQCQEQGAGWTAQFEKALNKMMPQSEDSTKYAAACFKKMLDGVAEGQSPTIKRFLNFSGDFAESAILKIFRDFMVRVNEMDASIETQNPSLLERALSLALDETTAHFRLIGKHKKLFQRRGAEAKLIRGFKQDKMLHPGMESEQQRLDVFRSWSSKLLVLIGMEPDSLGVPDFMKNTAWEGIQDALLPTLLTVLFDKIKDPHTLDQMLLVILEKVSSPFQNEGKSSSGLRETFFPRATKTFRSNKVELPSFKDDYEKQLEAKLGSLVRHVLSLRAAPFSALLLRIPFVRRMVGSSAGPTLRANLRTSMTTADGKKVERPVSFKELLGTGMDLAVANLMPCEKKDGKWIYRKVAQNNKKEGEVIAEPDLTELFPITKAEKEKAEKNEAARRAAAAATIEKGLPRAVKYHVDAQVLALISAPFDAFVDGFVKAFLKIVLSRHKNKVETFLRKAFWLVRRYIIFPTLMLLSLPLWLPVRSTLHYVLAKRGMQQVQDLKHGIHRNFYYRVTDALLGYFEEKSRSVSTKTA